jgi:hypothetical protein
MREFNHVVDGDKGVKANSVTVDTARVNLVVPLACGSRVVACRHTIVAICTSAPANVLQKVKGRVGSLLVVKWPIRNHRLAVLFELSHGGEGPSAISPLRNTEEARSQSGLGRSRGKILHSALGLKDAVILIPRLDLVPIQWSTRWGTRTGVVHSIGKEREVLEPVVARSSSGGVEMDELGIAEVVDGLDLGKWVPGDAGVPGGAVLMPVRNDGFVATRACPLRPTRS